MVSLLERTMEILMKRYPLVASLSLIIPTADCFVVFGGSRSSSGVCCSGRRLHDANGHSIAPKAPGGKLTSLLHIEADKRRALVYGSGLIAPSCVRKAGMHLLATMEDQRGGYRMNGADNQYVEGDEGPIAASGDHKKKVVYLEEFEAYLRDTEGQDVYPLLKGLHGDDRIANDGEFEDLGGGVYKEGTKEEDKNRGVTGGSVDKGEDELAGKNDYLITISDQDFFDDLVPVEEYQPTDFPDDAMYSREELMNANLSCAENPFDDSSFYVDRDIKVGNIDEKKKEAIQPMMRVVEQVCELIDTTDDVFSFKYTGLIVNKRGIEAWTKKLVKDCYPEAKDVKLITNRTRDERDY